MARPTLTRGCFASSGSLIPSSPRPRSKFDELESRIPPNALLYGLPSYWPGCSRDRFRTRTHGGGGK